MDKTKKILIVGAYDSEYSRNKVLIQALRETFDIKEINFFKKNFCIFLYFKKIWQNKKSDYIFFLQPVHKFAFSLLFIKIFYRGKIISDCFTSVYDTYINDRKLAKKFSVKGLYYYLQDYLICRLSDILVFDTKEHQEYFSKTFRIKKKKKKITLPVVPDMERIEKIQPKSLDSILGKGSFRILFYGYYIPLQGVEYIIKAAKLLEDEKQIQFLLIGNGQTRKEINNLAQELEIKNIKFLDRIPFEELISYIKSADLCLGIFGDTAKAKRVIPNKILDYMVCEKITISGRSQAMGRFFRDKKEIIYCNLADEKDLAEKIKLVKDNFNDFKKIGEKSNENIKNNFSKHKIAGIIKEEF